MILPSGLSTTDYSILANKKFWGSGWPNCTMVTTTITIARSGMRLSVNTRVARLFTLLLNEMERGGYLLHHPEQWSWGAECRAISGTNTPSNHSWGLAVDINAPNNSYNSTGQHDIPDWVYAMFRKYGFGVGADYSGKKDWMHVEFMGTPGDADILTVAAERAFASGAGTTPTPETPAAPVKTADEIEEEELMSRVDDIFTELKGLRQAIADLPTTMWVRGITGDGAGQHANELLAAAATNAAIAANAVTKRYDVVIYEDKGGLWWSEGGESRIIPDQETLKGLQLVATTAGKRILDWPGGDVDLPGAFGAQNGVIPGPDPEHTVPPAASLSYTVAAGDSLGAIATRHNVTVEAILAANPQIVDKNAIEVGQVITIPKA